MDILRKATGLIYHTFTGQTKQEWSTDKSKKRVMLVGDDTLDNYTSSSTPDIYQTLNAYSDISCFNCAIKGHTMGALLTNKSASSVVKLNRPYEYPQLIDGQFNVLNWADRTHWVVLSVGYNEKKLGLAMDTHEQQLNQILDTLLKRNKNCIVVSSEVSVWSEFKTMVEKVCATRKVLCLVNSPTLAQDIYSIVSSKSTAQVTTIDTEHNDLLQWEQSIPTLKTEEPRPSQVIEEEEEPEAIVMNNNNNTVDTLGSIQEEEVDPSTDNL